MKQKYTKEFIIQDLKEVCEAFGRPPTKKEFVDYSVSKTAYMAYFDGSFNKLKEAAGIPVSRPKHRKKDLTVEKILHSIKEVATKNPKESIYWVITHCEYPEATIKRYIGGIEEISAYIDNPKRYQKYCREDLISELEKAAVEYPDVVSVWTLISYCKASEHAYLNYVGETKKLYEIVNKARQKAIVQKILGKRYPIKYKSAPIILKWTKKRAYWLKNA